MPRVVRVDEPLRPTDTDLRDAHLEGIDLRGRDLSAYPVDDLTLYSCDVEGLRLPDVYVEMRYTRGDATQPVLHPFMHDTVGQLYLNRASEAGRRRVGRHSIAAIAVDIGAWVRGDYHTSWRPANAIFSERYSERAMDETVRFVCADHPELLARWEKVKAEPMDAALIPDSDFDLGPGGVIKRRADGVLMIHRKGALPQFALPPTFPHPHDRYAVARALEPYVRRFLKVSGGRLDLHIDSLEPFRISLKVT